jgi:hypothetical protein
MLYSFIRRLRNPLVLSAALLLSTVAAEAQFNTATGSGALVSVTTGSYNSAFGYDALNADTTGANNSAFGFYALLDVTTGAANAAVGYESLRSIQAGNYNTAVGDFTLPVLLSGSTNIALGYGAGRTYTGSESKNILIGSDGLAGDSSVIRIGSSNQTKAFIAGISGVTSASGSAVFINTAGQLGTVTSSKRFKEDIVDMGDASQGLLKLRPVRFYYKPEYDDGSHLQQYGLIAEEVAKVYPGLVQYDKDGKPFSVRYQFVDAMLLNEVQQQHRQIEELQRQVQALLEQYQAGQSR